MHDHYARVFHAARAQACGFAAEAAAAAARERELQDGIAILESAAAAAATAYAEQLAMQLESTSKAAVRF